MKSQVNYVDSDGVYPKRRHWNNSSINWRARGLKVNDLWGVGSYPSIDTSYSFTQLSQFPHNQVNETPGGHIIEYEDTPGEERILVRHKSGTGIDMRPDGSIIISTRRNRMEYVTGDDTLIVDGDANLIYNGNLKMEVAGDWDVNVGGDYNLEVGGQKKQRIKGSEINRVEKNKSETIIENRSSQVLGEETTLVMGNRIDVTDGTYNMLVADKTELKFTDDVRVSSTADINIASIKFQTVSTEVGIIAPEGTIGGEEVQHFGKIFAGPTNGSGKTASFHGSLVGIAAEAITSRYAVYAEESWTSMIGKYAVTATGLSNVPIPLQQDMSEFAEPILRRPDYKMIWINETDQLHYTENKPEFNMPTADVVRGILSNTNKGIVNFRIFSDDIKDQLSFKEVYDGLFFSDPSADELRNAELSGNNIEAIKAKMVARGLGQDWVIPETDSFGYDSVHLTYPANNPPWRDV